MIKKTEWFEYVSDEDLQATEACYRMVMYSHEFKTFAVQKACGNRSIFNWDVIYHPMDGNCVILEGNLETVEVTEEDFLRVTTVKELERCIIHANS